MDTNTAVLTVKEVSELKGCTERGIRKLIKEGKLTARKDKSPVTGRYCHIIPVETLPDDLKKQYYKQIGSEAPPEMVDAEKPRKRRKKQNGNSVKKPFEQYCEEERNIITKWSQILMDWQNKRTQYVNATEADKDIVGWLRMQYPDTKISVDILYRKWASYRDGDLDGLLDGRGGWNRGKTAIPDPVWKQFCWYYLDQNQRSVSLCYECAVDAAKLFWPEMVSTIPSEQAFRRRIKREIPAAVATYMRKGEKACFDAYTPYIERMYDEIQANDCWIADNHTWDVMVKRDDGTDITHRLYLTAFLDAKSGVITGWNVTDNPCSDSTIFAIRQGILRHGIPHTCYFDNGTEFLTYDIAGRGHRTRKSQINKPKPQTILDKLDIEMRNAIVRNAKAKPIERTFYTLKEHISKVLDSYCGGTPAERPEKLKRKIHDGQIPTDSEFRRVVDALIEGYNAEAYGGPETRYEGMTRMDVWNDSIKTTIQRIADPEDLNLMLMRSTRSQKVKRNGVYITIAGEKLWYNSGDDPQTTMAVGDQVYVRYDPTDLTEVRIYDTEDRYLYTWGLERGLLLDFLESDQDKLADANARVRRNKRTIRDVARGYADIPAEFKLDALDVRIRKAQEAKEGIIIGSSPVVQPIRPDAFKETEVEDLPIAVGGGNVVPLIDIDRMNANAARRRKQMK